MTPWWVPWFGDASLDYASLSENALIAAQISGSPFHRARFLRNVSVSDEIRLLMVLRIKKDLHAFNLISVFFFLFLVEVL